MGKVIRRSIQKRWGILLSLIVLVSAGLVLQAVHDLAFELDGNVVNDPGGLPVDWADLFKASTVADPFGGATNDPLPTDFSDADLTRDFELKANGAFSTNDNTTFATGSKDTLPISGWQCNRDSNVNDKIDIANAYATAYKAPNGDQVLYFALERFANNGDANVGFWFLQDAVGCVSSGPSVTFTGAHKDGDLLIVSAFTGGGTVSSIKVFRWNIPNPAADPIGSLDVDNVVAEGKDCRDPNAPAGDASCATANTASITVPWLTATKTLGVGHTLPTAQFFEGGLNLTQSGLGGKCFNVFIGDTRSSQSPTATLFDFAEGTIGECNATIVTTPSTLSTSIGTTASVTVSDSALLTVEGASSFTGTIAFHLCGPFDAGATTLCSAGGVAAGTTNVTANGTYGSTSMTVTEAGRYCWRADFSASAPAGIPPASDSRDSECFLITPLKASLATAAGAGPVNFGSPVTDTATLTGTANHQGSGGPTGSTDGSINPATPGGKAGGTITFTLYGPNNCTTVATGTGTNPQTVSPVIGDGSYGPVSFTPNFPGTYHWVVSYTGDLPNTGGDTHNATCNDTAEDVVVRQIPTAIKTKQSWIPNDTAEISSTIGNLAAGGTVSFSLYANATCTGSAVFSQLNLPVPGGAPSAEVSTNNTTFTIATNYADPAGSIKGKYSWKIVYTPALADTAHTGKQSACDAENFTITYTNDPGPGSNIP